MQLNVVLILRSEWSRGTVNVEAEHLPPVSLRPRHRLRNTSISEMRIPQEISGARRQEGDRGSGKRSVENTGHQADLGALSVRASLHKLAKKAAAACVTLRRILYPRRGHQ
jgi:hypothetical protein